MPKVKNKMTGEVVANQPYTAQGTQMAEKIAATDPNLEIDYAPGGTNDARMMREQMYAGGGKTGYSKIGAQMPSYKKGGKAMMKDSSSDMYEEGGKVKQSIYEKNKAKRDKIAARKAERKAKRQARKNKKSGVVAKDTSREEKRNVKKIQKLQDKGVKVTTTAKSLKDKKNLKPTGKIKKKDVTKVLVTKGGAYPTYKKESKPAKSFREAFKGAKGSDFTWQGRKYSGKTKEQAAKAKAKVKPKKKAGGISEDSKGYKRQVS